MAHLTCEAHGRRSLVIEPKTGPLTRLIHRQDGSRCDRDGFVKYRGHTVTQFVTLTNQLPKFKKLTRKQEREQMLQDINEGRVTIIQSELRPPR